MKSLRELARGQPCYLRFPGVCSGDPAKVVPCHLRRGGVAGVGQKPPPIACMPGCFECHAVLDGRAKSEYGRDELDAIALRGYVQWLSWLWSREILTARPFAFAAE